MASSTVTHENKFLVGNVEPKLDGDKLPTNRQVLKVLLYDIQFVNPRKNIRVSAKAVINEVKVFWMKARLPMQQDARCIEKLLKLHQKWATLQKNAGKTFNMQNEEMFSSELDKLFNIAPADIVDKIDQKRRNFLENQQKYGCIDPISELEKYFEQIEAKQSEKKNLLTRRLEKSQMDIDILGKITFNMMKICSRKFQNEARQFILCM